MFCEKDFLFVCSLGAQEIMGQFVFALVQFSHHSRKKGPVARIGEHNKFGSSLRLSTFS